MGPFRCATWVAVLAALGASPTAAAEEALWYDGDTYAAGVASLTAELQAAGASNLVWSQVWPGAAITQYPLVFIDNPATLTAPMVADVQAYVAGGGRLVLVSEFDAWSPVAAANIDSLLGALGLGARLSPAFLDCFVAWPSTVQAPADPVLLGVTSPGYACSTDVALGPATVELLRGFSGQVVLASEGGVYVATDSNLFIDFVPVAINSDNEQLFRNLWPGPGPCDADGDGSSCVEDCDDLDPATHPEAIEIADGVDQDCDGTVDEGTDWFDDDGDGVAEAGGDCDDADAGRAPGLVELCDARDEDCDGAVDEGTSCADDDGDGWCESACTEGSLPGDCADADPAISPAAVEVPDTIDDNCDGVGGGPEDADRDGWADALDCSPADPANHPGAAEIPDGVDQDCDGLIDEGTSAFDDDGDGLSEDGGDCLDSDATVGPGSPEVPNGRDDDCDGLSDEGTARADDDGDGTSEIGGDCDDADATVESGAPELPNGRDDDCDGEVDEGLDDPDGDHWTVERGDCDDTNGWVNPEQPEWCGDGRDSNCDGRVDEDCGPNPTGTRVDPGGCSALPVETLPSGLALLALGVLRRRARPTPLGIR